MWYREFKNLSKCLSLTLVSSKLNGLSKHYPYRRQEPRRGMRTMRQHNITQTKRHLSDMFTKQISNSRLPITQQNMGIEQLKDNSALMNHGTEVEEA